MINITGKTARAGQQFLRFHLSPDTTALLPVHQMTEVLNIPVGQIVPIPHMPAYVMGVYNWRGEILWMVDLGHLLGLTPIHAQPIALSNYTAITIYSLHDVEGAGRPKSRQTMGRKMLGLIVNRVEDMEWCDPDLIQSPSLSAAPSELVPFLRGYWLKASGEIMVVLDSNAIIAGMPQPE